MSRLARCEYLDPQEIQVVHITNRCVRRAFLCGKDSLTGQSFEHRRTWLRERLQLLASVFAIDCLTYAAMSNHLHIVLRNRPDIASGWTPKEIACRWLRLFPKSRNPDGSPSEPTTTQINQFLSDTDRVEEIRIRLSNVSWWMRCVDEYIARRANKEDECTGRFWEGRFHAQLILDESSLLACAVYVDLNPIRSAIAETPEQWHYTGAKDRIDDLICLSKANQTEDCDETNRDKEPCTAMHISQRAKPNNASSEYRSQMERLRSCREREGLGPRSQWLSPIEINENKDPAGEDIDESGFRASKKGFLSMSVVDYLTILEWTGRNVSKSGQSKIPGHVAPLLERLGIHNDVWIELVNGFGSLFKRAAGNFVQIKDEARRRGLSYLHAPGAKLLSKLPARIQPAIHPR